MRTGPVPPVLLVTWHFLAIRFGRAPRSERPVRVRSFPDPIQTSLGAAVLAHLGPLKSETLCSFAHAADAGVIE
jgi:hypothetical protein